MMIDIVSKVAAFFYVDNVRTLVDLSRSWKMMVLPPLRKKAVCFIAASMLTQTTVGSAYH